MLSPQTLHFLFLLPISYTNGIKLTLLGSWSGKIIQHVCFSGRKAMEHRLQGKFAHIPIKDHPKINTKISLKEDSITCTQALPYPWVYHQWEKRTWKCLYHNQDAASSNHTTLTADCHGKVGCLTVEWSNLGSTAKPGINMIMATLHWFRPAFNTGLDRSSAICSTG